MGDNQGIQQVLEKLAQLLTAKAGDASSSHSAIVPHSELIQKIELMPNEIKLDGIKNYLSWSRRAVLILKTKGLEGFVEGKTIEPVDKTSAEWRTWSTTNSSVVAWLLNSLSPSIAATVETISSAAEVWNTLLKLYSGKGNVMLMVETQERLSDLRQGERSVMEYVAELQRLWADLDHYDHLDLPHADCISTVKKWIERRRVIQFLKGLNSEFEGRCATMFHQPTLPTLEEAIAAVAQEEVRLKVMSNNSTTSSRPAFIVTRNSETQDCFNCGESGHLSRDCDAPRKPYRGRGRGNDRGGPRGGRGGPRGGRGRGHKIGHKANVALQEEGLFDKVEVFAKELEELKKKMESTCDKGQGGSQFGDFAHFSYANEGNLSLNVTSTLPQMSISDWILDSGASKHVAGTSKEFESYTKYPPTRKETIQTADGTSQPIKGIGTIQCTPSIKLSSVLHVPAFPINLVSMSALVDDIDCQIIVDRYMCLIQERQTGRRLGTGTRNNGLWYMDREVPNNAVSTVLAAIMGEKEAMVMLQHCRLGHMSFDKMSKICADVMCGVDKNKLVCDACEFGKHTRTSYVSKGIRSISPFVLVHSDVWTCPVISVSGMKYFVTFIDCYSRMTWVYLMRHKDEVLRCFQDFYAYVKNQFNTQVQMIRTDNGTEYVNNEFNAFLSAQGILHQTSCPYTPPQNGVAERKNRHILEVARSLMYTMNVPKFLWSEAVMTATYLINRMPSRVISMKTPYEMLLGENKFVVPPKVFGCTCFVRDHRPSVGKLDPRAVKCIFIGYPSGQKGYKCWSPTERRTFVSMDVTFRESDPFYGEKTDLSSLFDFDSPSTNEDSREGESEALSTNENEPLRVVVDSIPCTMIKERWRKPNEEANLKVYIREDDLWLKRDGKSRTRKKI